MAETPTPTAATWRTTLGILRRWNVFTWERLGVVFGLSLASVGLEVASIAMIYPILTFIEAGRDIGALTAKSTYWQYATAIFGFFRIPITLATLSLAVVLLVFARQLSNYWLAVEIERQKWSSGADLGQRCFSTVLNSRPQHLQTITAGRFVTLVDGEAQACAALWRSLTASIRLIVSFVVYVGAMFVTSPGISLMAMMLVLLVTVLMQRYFNVSRALSRDVLKKRRALAEFISERWQAWKVLRLSGTLGQEIENFRTQSLAFADASVHLTSATQRVQLLLTPVMTGLALLLVYMAVEVFSISVTVLTVFVLMLLRLVPLAQTFASQAQSMANFAASVESVDQELKSAKQHREPSSGSLPFLGIKREIRFDAVTFSYRDGEKPAIDGMDLAIKGGVLTAVTGPSGAGKSTMTDLLPRLITPSSGSITIDGTPIEDFSLPSLRSGIAYAPQTAFIFNASVRANIRYANPRATDAEIETACRRSHAHEFIQRLPQGYDTILGEGGSRLSGGQRQRLALARVFLTRPHLLILDEPTSALDHESERHVHEGLRELVRVEGTTVITVAHHLSTVLEADHLVVLERGRVTVTGPPAELMEKNAWLAAMFHNFSDESRQLRTVDPMAAE